MALRSYLDGRLLAEVYGSGPFEVLALHGWGRRGSDFANSLNGFSAIAPDLPGFGATPPPGEALGAEGYAAVLAPLLDLFDRPPVVVGHSFGGRIAVCLAANHPERVGPLVMTGVPLTRIRAASSPSIGFRLARWANRVGLLSDERIEGTRRRRGSADYRAATGVMRDVLVRVVNESYEEQIARCRQRVLMLWGAADSEVPVEVARGAIGLFGEATLEVLDGVGHFVPTEAAGELNRTIAEALG